MKVLIFGPSGSGKTYVAKAWKRRGIPAYEDGDINGLSCWYDKNGNKVATPTTASEALDNHYSFLWSKRVLQKFLSLRSEVYLFGGSGNIFDVINLFDKTFFLKIEPLIQRERILHSSRETPLMDFDEDRIIIWGEWIEQEAKKRNIPFVDATLSPDEIFEIISKH
ncbi:MAG TPA: hypothetical protein VH396_11280 [Chitinophagaceae bacterium]|jgi:hypothetical protein